MATGTFDVFDTVIFPIVGGIIAGIVVIAIELGVRSLRQWHQRRTAIKVIGGFFREYESMINNADALNVPQLGNYYTKEQVQFVRLKDFLRQFPIRMNRWSKHLSEKQTEEITLYIVGYEGAVLGIIPQDRVSSQEIYNDFFRKAREIEWLKF